MDYWKGPHYAGPPNSTRWYDVAAPAEMVGARAVV
jgi:hypothetical protein